MWHKGQSQLQRQTALSNQGSLQVGGTFTCSPGVAEKQLIRCCFPEADVKQVLSGTAGALECLGFQSTWPSSDRKQAYGVWSVPCLKLSLSSKHLVCALPVGMG